VRRTTTIATRLGAIACPVAGAIAVEAEVVAILPPIASSSHLSPTSICAAALIAALVAALGLVLLATTGVTLAITIPQRPSALLLLLLKGPPLLSSVEKLAGGGLRLWRALAVLGRLEPAGHVLDGELPEVK